MGERGKWWRKERKKSEDRGIERNEKGIKMKMVEKREKEWKKKKNGIE